MEIEVIFDRENHLYKFGEVISGKVVVMPTSKRTYSGIWITYQWRTHGQGNRESGNEEKVILMEENSSLNAGERMELPFRFEAPNGPVTYHGHFLNVDWYLTAYAQWGSHSDSKSSECDFLLRGGEPTDMISLGHEGILLEDLPDRSSDVPPPTERSTLDRGGRLKPQINWSITNWIFIVTIPIFILMIFNAPWFLYLLFYILLILGVIIYVIRGQAYKRIIRLGNVWIGPTDVWGGGKVYCHVDFIAKRDFHLRSITASLSARERVNSTAGTSIVTNYHVVRNKTYSQPFNEDLLKGRQITFDYAIQVSPSAPATFSTFNNALEWIVTLKSEFKGWPEWKEIFPITVLP